jgi:formylglycine-generating enzyme required for sulfatase activity
VALEQKHPNAFVNSLGMVFKSVPGTEVQFCIWETRVKDYAAYAAVNTSVDGEWKSPRFKQEDTHPVVKVSWNDAQAFCVWLTKKEVAAGKIKVGQRYRLPTDADWSVAVGLGKEVGKTAEESETSIRGAKSGHRRREWGIWSKCKRG